MKAVDTFHAAPYNHNCAQAIAYRWRKRFSDPLTVEKFQANGGGRAPEGLCGALYAAMQACPDHADEIKADFAKACGALHCRELKGANRVPCPVCVDTADVLVEKYADKNMLKK